MLPQQPPPRPSRSVNVVLAIADQPVVKVWPVMMETTVCPVSLASLVIAVLLLDQLPS